MWLQAALIAVIPQAGGVLNRQNVSAPHQTGGADAGGRDGFLRRYMWVAQEAAEANLPVARLPLPVAEYEVRGLLMGRPKP